ncbi:hypothetical protein BCM20_000664 [Clostridium beijerinckii]|nr:hypothetical protein [Clostridium beijerinckii]NYC00709.1 hypothetical protein [Clostridium beijerinckii]
MSGGEYSQLMGNGKFTAGQGQIENKWLSTNVDNANTWGEKMDFGGN